MSRPRPVLLRVLRAVYWAGLGGGALPTRDCPADPRQVRRYAQQGWIRGERGRGYRLTSAGRALLRREGVWSYHIEYLSGSGFWTPLCESTARTGFRMRPVNYATRGEAEEARAEMLRVSQWRGLRVVEES